MKSPTASPKCPHSDVNSGKASDAFRAMVLSFPADLEGLESLFISPLLGWLSRFPIASPHTSQYSKSV